MEDRLNRFDDTVNNESNTAAVNADEYCAQLFKNGKLTIKSAKRTAAGDSVLVSINAKCLLYKKEIEAVKAHIKNALEPAKTECVFDFFSDTDGTEKPLISEQDFLALWCEFSPQLAPVLAYCRIELSGSDYVIYAPERYMRALSQHLMSDFRLNLNHTYGVDCGITLIPDATLADGSGSAEPTVLRDYSPHFTRTVTKNRSKKTESRLSVNDIVYGREVSKYELTRMADLTDTSGRVTVKGRLLNLERITTKRHTNLVTMSLSDLTNTVLVKLFMDDQQAARTTRLLEKALKEPCLLLMRGFYRFDSYTSEYCLFPDDINRYPIEERSDTAPDKRVELHLHTKMSALDATTDLGAVIARAAKWGHKAIAITDHGVVHSFPEARAFVKKKGLDIKVIFGCEGYLIPDCELIEVDKSREFAAIGYVGVGQGSHMRLFDIAAVKFTSDGTGEVFRTPVNPGVALPDGIRKICGCTDEQIASAPPPADAVKALYDFIGDAVCVVHEREELSRLRSALGADCPLGTNCISSAMLLRYLRRDLKTEERAMPDENGESRAARIANTMIELIARQRADGITTLPLIDASVAEPDKQRSNHIIILAATQEGLKNLYKLVSYSNLEHFYRNPRIPRSLLNIHRKGLILGSACEAGELFRAMLGGASDAELEKIASFYDYLEIQPIGNNAFLMREEESTTTENDLRDYNRRIVKLGDKTGLPVVATGDVHFLEPEDSVFRAILMCASKYKDANEQPPLYFRTTDDMLKEFAYLGSKKAFEVVVENSNKIADMCEKLRPFLDDKQTYAPELDGAKEDLTEISLKRAAELYGDPLPEPVQKRLDKEFGSIIGNGYSSLYMVAQKLVSRSLADGYLVGSRGSVGSSFVAYLLGITEVNALPAHYRCEKCKHSEFPSVGNSSHCGIDLEVKVCPVCGEIMRRDGYDIPFETFLGFKGDKTPDIDLNFSGEYQPVAHKFTETMFGEGHAFRAGTISGLKEKTAYGYVLGYCNENNLNLSEAEKLRLVSGIVGVRKTTGQHPGGIVIVPGDLDIYDFCPVQHPAEKDDADVITTHFDFHALDDKLVKLDILGHDDPTALRMLQDITGVDPKTIPLDDPKTMDIFKTDAPLGVSLKALDCDIGSLGISEFGTGFVRGMLKQTRPTTMEELVRIAGLSHGTDVWLGNAQELIENGTANLMQVICTRDDIMNYLIENGCEPSISFKIMESVRKGRGLSEEMEDAMRLAAIPNWYIDSCKKIQYMFPRAHAAAYVMMSFRVAYFKVHFPLEYYAVFFTVRADLFDITLSQGGAEAVLKNLNALRSVEKPDGKTAEQITILELVYEMNLRGFELLPVDLYKSKATKFAIEDGKLRPPFNTVPGIGDNAAYLLEQGARSGPFISVEDLMKRTRLNSTNVEKLRLLGCLNGLPDSDQVALF